MKRGKKYLDAAKSIDRAAQYDTEEAIALVKKSATAKFDETIELHLRLGVDSRYADQQVRGAVVLPNGTGKKVRTLVFAKGDKAEAAKAAGAEVEVISADDFDGTDISSFDGVAFGCPAMGDEELEDSVFQPVFEACEAKLAGKKVALFGSYGWGDGEWMRSWEEKCQNDGVALAVDSVICNEEPDDEAQAACIELGKAIC